MVKKSTNPKSIYFIGILAVVLVVGLGLPALAQTDPTPTFIFITNTPDAPTSPTPKLLFMTNTPEPAPSQPPPTDTPVSTIGPTPDGTPRELRVPILMYHYVSEPPPDSDAYRRDLSVTPEQFREQMQFLKDNGYTPISLYDLHRALARPYRLPEKPVILTFDDGYADVYTDAVPILREFGFTATFFIVTEWLDVQQPGYLTWDQVRELEEQGFGFEAHSRSHLDMEGMSRPDLDYQIIGAQRAFQVELGRKPRFFVYPAGRWDENAIIALGEAGYWGALTTQHGSWHRTDDLFEMSRLRVRGDMSAGDFAALLRWAE
jgi:peptidoglycan/xylan/chitin deacetylase (PgdA/CDA1 family)